MNQKKENSDSNKSHPLYLAEEVFLFKYFFIFFCFVMYGNLTICAQLHGRIIDSSTGQPIPAATIAYRDGKIVTVADSTGQFQISRVDNGILSISSLGYESFSYIVRIDSPNEVPISLTPVYKTLEEVVVSGKRTRYKRKYNPAVELMRKVIASKRQYDLRNNQYLKYTTYQKVMGGLNDLQSKDLTRGIFENRPWLRSNLEVCPYNGKLIMPVTLEETVTRHYYRKEPKFEKEAVIGHNISGLNTLFQTGELINVILNEYFPDIDIYEDNIKLFQNSFCSPIGRDAIAFYHYYITDTLSIGDDKCYQLDFTPSNRQDFGFSGQLYILADSSYQVKRCEMTIPVSSDVNWVNGMKSVCEYTMLDDGARVKSVDDMVVELMVTKFTAKLIVVRNATYTDFSFEPFSDSFHQINTEDGKTTYYSEHNDSVLGQMRKHLPLSNAENALDSLVINIEKQHGAKVLLLAMRSIFENFIETGTKKSPSKIDVGPVLSTLSHNFYDGLRLRLGGQTTANLNSHLFIKGYYAYATKSHESYYDGQLIYTFNTPKYLPQEFPRRSISFDVMRDVALPSDKYTSVDKDNLFSSLKINDIDKMFLYHRQSLGLQYECEYGLRYYGELKHENVQPIGNISFITMSSLPETRIPSLNYSELTFGVRFSPGETYLNSKQERWTLNYDSPVLRFQHTIGIKGFLGGDYKYNYTEVEIGKRFWLPMNFGSIDTNVMLGAQWNQVPYPLLIMPAANDSYIIEQNTFGLINNMEFLNDRFLSAQIGWDLNGKFFNRIPLLKKMKCREYLGFKCLWGKLTDKNNPNNNMNNNSNVIMFFPEGSYIMDSHRPYMELSFGIHNIFNILHLEYIKRLSYLDLPTSRPNVVKFKLEFKF